MIECRNYRKIMEKSLGTQKKTVKKTTEIPAVSFEATIYNQKGKEAGKINLLENVFGLKWNADLVHQVATSMESSARTPVAHVKNRGEVRGGGKKPWKQKGTGRARHGSIRSPIWVGGGVTHGPNKDKNFFRKVNKKMKAKALYTLLSAKLRDGQILFVDSLSLGEPKTKFGREALISLSKIKGFSEISSKRKNAAYIAMPEKNQNVFRSLSNFSNMAVDEIRNINPLDLLKYKYVIICNPNAALLIISQKLKK